MKRLNRKNLQRQITNIIPIIELCLPLIKEIEQAKNKLNILPSELENLKQQLEYLKLEPSQATSNDSQSPIKETESKLDFVVDDLEVILANLTTLDSKINNLIVLKERLEAIQEERIDGLTPERSYKLLEKQQQQALESSERKSTIKTNYFDNLWQKIANYKYAKELAMSTAITLGTVLCFSMFAYSLTKSQVIETNIIEEPQESKSSPAEI